MDLIKEKPSNVLLCYKRETKRSRKLYGSVCKFSGTLTPDDTMFSDSLCRVSEYNSFGLQISNGVAGWRTCHKAVGPPEMVSISR